MMKQRPISAPLKLSPRMFVTGWRCVQLSLFVYLWFIGDQESASIIFILLMLVMVVVRWRFELPLGTVFIDVILCLLFATVSPLGYYGLSLPIFELALKGRWLLSLCSLLILLFAPLTGLMFWNNVQALVIGSFASSLIRLLHNMKLEADEQRIARNELERFNQQLLQSQRTIVRRTELMERYRISRQLHDHLGHELTGASLALQAYDFVEEKQEAESLLYEVKQRLMRSVEGLRETVHNEMPTALLGIDRLKQIADGFHKESAVTFHQSGNMAMISTYTWDVLESVLKETLTNIARHSNATEVKIELQVTKAIVRMSIKDNGTLNKHETSGTGLRGLRLRAHAIGGSMTVNRQDGYHVILVIPVEQGGK